MCKQIPCSVLLYPIFAFFKIIPMPDTHHIFYLYNHLGVISTQADDLYLKNRFWSPLFLLRRNTVLQICAAFMV